MPTGTAVAIPEGMVARCTCGRGLAARVDFLIRTVPAHIDAAFYRGEIKVSLITLDPTQP